MDTVQINSNKAFDFGEDVNWATSYANIKGEAFGEYRP